MVVGLTARTWAAASRKEEALWMLDSLVPGCGVNNLTTAIRVNGALDVGDLRAAITVLIRRHPALRTVFRTGTGGLARDVMDPQAVTVDVPTVTVPTGQFEPELRQFAARPFAIDGSPLLRAARVTDGEVDIVLLVIHHLIGDAVSTEVIARELAAVYAARREGIPTPEELTCEVPSLVETPPRPESLAYWHEQLRGLDAKSLDLWCGSTVPDDPLLIGDYVTRPLSGQAREAVRGCRRRARAPEAVVLLAAYFVLLARHGAGPDLVVGTPANIRPLDTPDAVGYHINTLPLRVRVDLAAPFHEFVRQVRDVFFEALSFADVPVDLVLGDVRDERTRAWRNPVFRHLFNYVPDTASASSTSLAMGDVTGRSFIVENGSSKFDLEFFFVAAPNELRLRAAYDTQAFTRADVSALMDRFESLLVELGNDPDLSPGDACLLCAVDRQVIESAHQARRTWPAGTVLDRVAARVRADPDAIAVEDGEERTTYGQLWQQAVHLADRLRESGTGPGSVVALLLPRGRDLTVAALASWLAGAAYLPLDPEHPAQRLEFQLTDAGAGVVVAGADVLVPDIEGITVLSPTGTAPEPAPVDEPPSPLSGEAPAYLIYTSGSTGRPKGTLVTQHSLVNLVEHFAEQLVAGSGETTLWMTTFSFDVSALELFLPLVTGGRVGVCPDRARVDGRVLAELLDRHQVRIVQATPTTWRFLLDGVAGALKGRRVLCGGEPLSPLLADRLAATGCELWNVYGPTETTIWSTSGRIEPDVDGVRVGRPIANTRALIVDPRGKELPVGVTGELWLAGDGVAVGYHGHPELTGERFVHHPDHGRAYRSGDLARWTDDGDLEILGRLDRQVKIRGNRVELGEVESALESHPQVAAAAVVLDSALDGDGALVAFLVPSGSTVPGPDDLWRQASDLLPRAAVPGHWHVVAALPRTGNDKVDYQALLALARERACEPPGGGDNDPGTDAAAEGDPVVGELIELWRQMLGRDDVVADSNFFAMGGHSLLAAQLLQRIEQATQVRVRLADVFAEPTPAGLARFLRRHGGAVL